MRRSGRPRADRVARGRRPLVVPQDRRSEHARRPHPAARARASGRSTRRPRPSRRRHRSRPAPPGSQRRSPSHHRVGDCSVQPGRGISKSYSADADPDDRSALVDEDRLGRGRRRVDADDVAHLVSAGAGRHPRRVGRPDRLVDEVLEELLVPGGRARGDLAATRPWTPATPATRRRRGSPDPSGPSQPA